MSLPEVQPKSERSVWPSPSLSMPSEHWGFGDSEVSLPDEQPKSARSIFPSPSLSMPSLHCGAGFATVTEFEQLMLLEEPAEEICTDAVFIPVEVYCFVTVLPVPESEFVPLQE